MKIFSYFFFTIALTYLFACGPYKRLPIFYAYEKPDRSYSHTFIDFSRPMVPIKKYVEESSPIRPFSGVVFLWLSYRNLISKPATEKEIAFIEKMGLKAQTETTYKNWQKVWEDLSSKKINSVFIKNKSHELIQFISDEGIKFACTQLEKLIQKYGRDSKHVQRWINNQSAVFNQEPLKDLEDDATKEERQHFAYQKAASNFYKKQLNLEVDEDPIQSFKNIAEDEASPYKDIALYMIFRCHFLNIQKDHKHLNAFHDDLNTLKEKIKSSPYRKAIEGLSRRIHFKTDCVDFAHHLEIALLSENNEDELFDLYHDLHFVFMTKGPQKLGINSKDKNDFFVWVKILRNQNDLPKALDYWKTEKNTLWLIAVLEHIEPDSPDFKEVEEAARAVKKEDPAYLTVVYQLSKLYEKASRVDEVKKLLDIKKETLATATYNRFLDMLSKCSQTIEEYLTCIIQTIPEQPLRKKEESPTFFSAFFSALEWSLEDSKPDETDFGMHHHTILQLISTEDILAIIPPLTMPQKLKERFLIAAYTRSIILNDMKKATQAATCLIAVNCNYSDLFKDFLNAKNERDQHAFALYLILKIPGFSIFINPLSWRDSLDLQTTDKRGFLENWWHDHTLEDINLNQKPRFLNDRQWEASKKEWLKLKKTIKEKTDYFCKNALLLKDKGYDFLPQMMHICVGMSKYDMNAPKSSFLVYLHLHKHFKHSKAAKETPYHFWKKSS